MTEVKRSRRSFLRHATRVAAAGAGGLLGMSALPANACAIWCVYTHTGNTVKDPCQHKRIHDCTSACDGNTFQYCTSTDHGDAFCLSRNVC
jgi:hypothetical protein